jgi:hypothetical protein
MRFGYGNEEKKDSIDEVDDNGDGDIGEEDTEPFELAGQLLSNSSSESSDEHACSNIEFISTSRPKWKAMSVARMVFLTSWRSKDSVYSEGRRWTLAKRLCFVINSSVRSQE